MDTVNLKRWHNMVVAAFADEPPTPEEKVYLENMRRELGVSTEEAEKVSRKISGGTEVLMLEGSPSQQRSILRDVILVAIADGEIHPAERKVIEHVAGHIGLTDAELDAMIEVCRAWSDQSAEAAPAAD